jgi:hypothetical protein
MFRGAILKSAGLRTYGTVVGTAPLGALSPPLELREATVICTAVPEGKSLNVASLSLTIVVGAHRLHHAFRLANCLSSPFVMKVFRRRSKKSFQKHSQEK